MTLMNNPTRQEMLDAINLKIARTSQSDEGTGHFLPVMIGDVLGFFLSKHIRCMFLFENWSLVHLPISEQSDDCISYIYSLL